jgi:hypothetical protein
VTINIYWDGDLNDSNPHYAALSDNDKRFLCPEDLMSDMSVPTILILTHVGFITEETIPHIIGRLDFANGIPIKDRLEDRSMKMGYASLEDHLRVFIGVGSNWPFLSKSEFVKRIAKFAVPDLTLGDIQKMISKKNKLKKQVAA